MADSLRWSYFISTLAKNGRFRGQLENLNCEAPNGRFSAFEFSCVDSIAGALPRSLAAEPRRKVLAAGSPRGWRLRAIFFFLGQGSIEPRLLRALWGDPGMSEQAHPQVFSKGKATRSEAQLVLSVGTGLDKLAIGAGLDGIRRFHMNSSKVRNKTGSLFKLRV